MNNPVAFPQQVMQHANGEFYSPEGFVADAGGMRLRDYFAAHAPDSVPDWFTHQEPPKNIPPMPTVEEVDEVHRDEVKSWLGDPCFDLSPELQWVAEKARKHDAAQDAWRAANRAARFFQWRWWYAHQMLAERAK